MDIHEISDFADIFIICNGTSSKLLDALVKAVVDKARDTQKAHGKVEGASNSGWQVIDFGNVIVHLFSPDQRDYYQLEQLWSRGKVLLRVQ
jgi:ribosome-associated protein